MGAAGLRDSRRCALRTQTKAKLLDFSAPNKNLVFHEALVRFLLGAAGLEPAEAEAGGFTVPCNCHYATPPKMGKQSASEEQMLAKGIEPSTIRLQVGRSTIELRQRSQLGYQI